MNLLEVRDLRVRHGETCVLDGISFDLHSGVTMLLGRNGSGKSTLLRALLGMAGADGSAKLDGENLLDMPPRLRARRIAYLPQRQSLPATMRVLDYVSLGASPDRSLFSLPDANARNLARARLAELSISHLEARRMDEISGGEARLAALARARMQNCRVLFMDEPLSGLDFRRQHEFLTLLRREEHPVLLSIHNPLLACQYGDRILVLDQGRLLTDCSQSEQAVLERALRRAYGPEIAFVQIGENRLPLWNPTAAKNNEERGSHMNYRAYALPDTLEEAWQLNQRRGNHILGGGMWLRMRKAPFHTAIDLSALPLREIEDVGDSYRIDAMVPLHDLETSAALNALCGDGFRQAMRGIVGVQFRNCATAGGSVFPRFGFSDVLTLFLALDADVTLYKAGTMPLARFLNEPSSGDILTHISIQKRPVKLAYLSQRNSATDFPVLTCAVSEIDGAHFACIGARPGRVQRVACPAGMCAEDFATHVQKTLNYGSNMRASETYRRRIAGVLVRRGCEQIERCSE